MVRKVKHGEMTGMPAKDTIKLTEKVIQFTDAGEVTGNLSGILLQVMIRPGVKPVAYSALFDHGLASKSDQRFASIRSTGNLTFSTAF
ncbi:hypothetical protein BU65_19680 [Escherichia coli]|nr:hypothetical protein BU65_19680 [Escherichia coli]KEO95463.1 hypothetical protein EH66_20830 [Escherichia coli]